MIGAHALRFVTRSKGIHDQDSHALGEHVVDVGLLLSPDRRRIKSGAPDHVNDRRKRACARGLEQRAANGLDCRIVDGNSGDICVSASNRRGLTTGLSLKAGRIGKPNSCNSSAKINRFIASSPAKKQNFESFGTVKLHSRPVYTKRPLQLAAAHDSGFGQPRHFAAMQNLVAIGAERTSGKAASIKLHLSVRGPARCDDRSALGSCVKLIFIDGKVS
jgi:hypothetical protein